MEVATWFLLFLGSVVLAPFSAVILPSVSTACLKFPLETDELIKKISNICKHSPFLLLLPGHAALLLFTTGQTRYKSDQSLEVVLLELERHF
jgi:hypothetical protein